MSFGLFETPINGFSTCTLKFTAQMLQALLDVQTGGSTHIAGCRTTLYLYLCFWAPRHGPLIWALIFKSVIEGQVSPGATGRAAMDLPVCC